MWVGEALYDLASDVPGSTFRARPALIKRHTPQFSGKERHMPPAVLKWLHYSGADQRRAREIVAMFSQRESRDELGIGRIRNALSGTFFPGSSASTGHDKVGPSNELWKISLGLQNLPGFFRSPLEVKDGNSIYEAGHPGQHDPTSFPDAGTGLLGKPYLSPQDLSRFERDLLS